MIKTLWHNRMAKVSLKINRLIVNSWKTTMLAQCTKKCNFDLNGFLISPVNYLRKKIEHNDKGYSMYKLMNKWTKFHYISSLYGIFKLSD